jgi:hypothetical protein
MPIPDLSKALIPVAEPACGSNRSPSYDRFMSVLKQTRNRFGQFQTAQSLKLKPTKSDFSSPISDL